MKDRTKKILFLHGLLIILVIWIFCILPKDIKGTHYTLSIQNKNVPLIVVDTPALRTQGLSGRKTLATSTGMFFVFDKADAYGFWMKDMKFPIDIIWLDEKGTIVHIEEKISPDTYPKIFIPPQKSLYVLEVNQGFASQNGLKVGNILNLIKK